MDFGEFILLHQGDDVARLALSRHRFQADVSDFDLALSTLEARRKLHGKVPEWYALPGLHYPLKLSAEQCSSSETARYKASVARKATDGTAIADLTGGLGVDSWAFSQVFSEVLYNEMIPVLADAARHNFALLGTQNITVRSSELCPGNLQEVLGGFRPDLIYLDPARRALDGRKVFRLEDCRPDVLQLLPELLQACPHLLLKLSPMADISLVCKQLSCVREVHVVAAEGECKELLLVLEKGWSQEAGLTVYENGVAKEILRCAQNDRGAAQNAYAGAEDLHGWLFEPGKALLKAGAFDWPSSAFGLKKLGRHTHLYVSETIIAELSPLGKWFHLLDAVPLNKRSLKETGKMYPQADVSTHNLALSAEALRSKMGVRDGGDKHIFGARIDALSDNYLLIAVKRK